MIDLFTLPSPGISGAFGSAKANLKSFVIFIFIYKLYFKTLNMRMDI